MNHTPSEIHPLDKLQDPITKEKFALACRKLFSQSWFSICEAEAAVGVINSQGKRSLSELRAVHCVEWSDMSPEMSAHILDVIAKAMVYSPIVNALGILDNDAHEAKVVLREILSPRRGMSHRTGRTLADAPAGYSSWDEVMGSGEIKAERVYEEEPKSGKLLKFLGGS